MYISLRSKNVQLILVLKKFLNILKIINLLFVSDKKLDCMINGLNMLSVSFNY